jgi:hypothetical protein
MNINKCHQLACGQHVHLTRVTSFLMLRVYKIQMTNDKSFLLRENQFHQMNEHSKQVQLIAFGSATPKIIEALSSLHGNISNRFHVIAWSFFEWFLLVLEENFRVPEKIVEKTISD